MRSTFARSQAIPPESIDAVFVTFDKCWALLGPALSGKPQEKIDATVELLAMTLVNAACAGHTNPATLQWEAVKALLKADLDAHITPH